MARGGKREGAGRKVSALTTKTRQLAIEAVETGITPLEFLISVMRDKGNELSTRLDAAKAAASYVYPKLASVEHKGDADHPLGIAIMSAVPRDDDQPANGHDQAAHH